MSSVRLQSLCVTDKTRAASIVVYSTSRCGTCSGTQINASQDAPLDSATAVDSAAVGVNAPRIFNMCRRFPRSKESSFQVACHPFGSPRRSSVTLRFFQYFGCVRDILVRIMAAVTFLFEAYFRSL